MENPRHMTTTEHRQRPFNWDETPRAVFGDGLDQYLAQGVRRAERELAAFLRQWCGTNFVPQTVEVGLVNDITHRPRD